MSVDVRVVGGCGYVGKRVVATLEHEGLDVEVIDPGYLVSETPDESQDVTSRRFKIPQDEAPVVWCACIHRLPDGIEDPTDEWGWYAEELMVNAPLEWIEAGHPLIYLSSMQVVTRGVLDTYAERKLGFERLVVGRAGVRVIRPGTVWGGLICPTDPANRVHTAVNRYLTTGQPPDDRWRAYITGMPNLIAVIGDAVDRAINGELPGDVICVTDWDRPAVRQDLLNSHALRDAQAFTARLGDWPVPPHPMALLAKARGLPWKETS